MYLQEDIKKVQNRLFEMAVIIKELFDRNNIEYFLCGGTLLGAIRHKGFIPWDDDFDLYCFDNTYDRAIKLLKEQLPNDMFVEDKESEPLYFHAWAHVKDTNTECVCDLFPQDSNYSHKGISIDIYRYVTLKQKEWPDYKHRAGLKYLDTMLSYNFISKESYDEKVKIYEEQRKMRKLLVEDPEQLAFCSANSKFMFPKDVILPISQVEFNGVKFSSPNKPEIFLSKVYGKDFMSLPPIEQRKPHYSEVKFLK